jgi:short-subunit dehydrogenase
MKTVLITGAACGIGQCLAWEFARAGYRLILMDRKQRALSMLMEQLAEAKIQATSYTRDITSEYALIGVECPDILINNAGIPYNGSIKDMNIDKMKELVDVNFIAPLNTIFHFLPKMRERKSGHIVNVSSGQTFFRLPSWGAYSAVKAALGIVSELLSYELASEGINVTTVYPFVVNTPFYQGIVGDTIVSKISMTAVPLYSDSPEKVASKIFQAVQDGKKVEYISSLNYLGIAIRAFPPIANTFTYITNKLFVRNRK